MIFQYYDPHPHVCHMQQYKCCKNYKDSCPLGEICKKMDIKIITSACKRDCPSCTYEGCSMPMEKRKEYPLYINKLITTERIHLPIEAERERERLVHKADHRRNWEFYNRLWGDLRERKNRACRERYASYPEFYRKRSREWYRKNHAARPEIIPEEIMPECRLECQNCKHDDCILPEDWKQRAWSQNWKKRNPGYYAEYREKNRALLREKGRKYYAENSEKIKTRRNARRQDPEVKRKRAEYDREYRKKHPEKEREKHKRYREKHRDEINARKREKRKMMKQEKDNSYEKSILSFTT